MAEGCVTRACALAIATAACVGLPAALIYAIVRIAAARRFGATFALALVLVFWVTVSAAYYPRICADIIPWSALFRRLRVWGQRVLHPAGGGGAAAVVAASSAVALRMPAVPARQGRHGGATTLLQDPPFVPPPPPPPPLPYIVAYGSGTRESYGRQQRDDGALFAAVHDARTTLCGGGMDALPREPPAARAGGGRRVGANCTLASSYELMLNGGAVWATDDGETAPCKRCAVCLCDVEKVETAAWLPACLHMFHRHCIDQWLHRHGHSTCPICRCDAFATPLTEQRATI